MVQALSPAAPAVVPVPGAGPTATPTDQPMARAPSWGCNAFDRNSCFKAAQHVGQPAPASANREAPPDAPTALRAMASLARSGVLQGQTPPSTKPGPDGIAVRPNERFISVFGKINGSEGTLLTAVAKRDSENAPWGFVYTIGARADQWQIEQVPIAGQPGRYVTTIGPLDRDLDFGGFGPPITLTNTGPLVVQPAADGRSASATIDGNAVFPNRPAAAPRQGRP